MFRPMEQTFFDQPVNNNKRSSDSILKIKNF